LHHIGPKWTEGIEIDKIGPNKASLIEVDQIERNTMLMWLKIA